MYVLLGAGFCALAGFASLGYVLGGVLALNKQQELQIAYQRLSRAIHEFLGDCPVGECGMLILGHDEMTKLRRTLNATDAMAGRTIEDLRR
jgi:hypothetical protein